MMKKADLIRDIATDLKLPESAVEKVIEAMLDRIAAFQQKGDIVETTDDEKVVVLPTGPSFAYVDFVRLANAVASAHIPGFSWDDHYVAGFGRPHGPNADPDFDRPPQENPVWPNNPKTAASLHPYLRDILSNTKI